MKELRVLLERLPETKNMDQSKAIPGPAGRTRRALSVASQTQSKKNQFNTPQTSKETPKAANRKRRAISVDSEPQPKTNRWDTVKSTQKPIHRAVSIENMYLKCMTSLDMKLSNELELLKKEACQTRKLKQTLQEQLNEKLKESIELAAEIKKLEELAKNLEKERFSENLIALTPEGIVLIPCKFYGNIRYNALK